MEDDVMYLIESTVVDLATTSGELYIANDGKTAFKAASRRLPIKFNPKISSFKTVIQEQKIDTIGGQFPVFFRNGAVNYKEIGISGLISYWMTDPDEFMDEIDLFNNNSSNIRKNTPVETQEDEDFSGRSTNLTRENVIAERKFREEVFAWLTNGQPKIFDSPTEGRCLVRLMNVSLSPNETLGRMLYSFSCTAYECGRLREANA